MSQSQDKCPCRTINLAKEGHTAEERRCKLLIFEKKPEPINPAHIAGAPLELGLKSNHPNAKRVRMCTAADIRTTCPPPVCSCPPAPVPLTTVQMLMRMLGFGIKTAIVGAFVCATYKAGLWGDAKTTECLYVELKNAYKGEDYSCVESGAPRIDRIMHEGRQKWNELVAFGFGQVNNLINMVTRATEEERDCSNQKSKKKK